MIPLAFAEGKPENLSSVNLQGFMFVVSAAIFGYGIKDTFLFKSIELIGISRSYTVALCDEFCCPSDV